MSLAWCLVARPIQIVLTGSNVKLVQTQRPHSVASQGRAPLRLLDGTDEAIIPRCPDEVLAIPPSASYCPGIASGTNVPASMTPSVTV